MRKTTEYQVTQQRYVSLRDLQKHLGVGRPTAEQLAQNAQARYKIGTGRTGRVIYDLERIDNFLQARENPQSKSDKEKRDKDFVYFEKPEAEQLLSLLGDFITVFSDAKNREESGVPAESVGIANNLFTSLWNAWQR